MTEEEKIEKIVKDKIQENVNKIIQNTLTENDLETLINQEINKKIQATNNFANLIRNLTQSTYYNGQIPIQTVQQVLTQVEKSKTDIQTLTNAYNYIITSNNDTINNIATKNQDALTLLNKTTNEAVNIKKDLSDYRDQVIDGALFSSFEERAKEYVTRA